METLVKNHVGRHCPHAIQNFLKLRMNAQGRLLQLAENHVGRHYPLVIGCRTKFTVNPFGVNFLDTYLANVSLTKSFGKFTLNDLVLHSLMAYFGPK